MNATTNDDTSEGEQIDLSANQFGLSDAEIDELLEQPEQDFDELLDESNSLNIDELLEQDGDDIEELLEQVASQKLDLPEGEWWP